MDDTLGLMEQLAGFLEKARDASSASQAVDGIKKLVPEFDKVADRSRAVGKPAGDVAQDLQKKFDSRRTQVLQRINAATEQARAMKETALLKALEAIGKSWSAIP